MATFRKNVINQKLLAYISEDPNYGKRNAYTDAAPSGLIKWYRVEMSYEDKYRFGLLTYQEYLEWMKLLNAESGDTDTATETATGERMSDTFWRDDTAERKNVSSSEYESFLSTNNVDVSNRNVVDFDMLSQNASEPVGSMNPVESSVDTTEDDIARVLSNVNKDMHGGEALLSQDEINALFAAAGA